MHLILMVISHVRTSNAKNNAAEKGDVIKEKIKK